MKTKDNDNMSLIRLLCSPPPARHGNSWGAPAKRTLTGKTAEEGKMRPPLRYLTRKIDERSVNVYENKGQ